MARRGSESITSECAQVLRAGVHCFQLLSIRVQFLVALQNAAYNAPPFPAEEEFGWIFENLDMPHVAVKDGPRSGIFIVGTEPPANEEVGFSRRGRR